MQSPKLEIACFNLQSALNAQLAGADRIEFCKDYSSGGTTPSIEEIIQLRKNISINIFVMIRPRPGDFVYSDSEFDQMKLDISEIKKVGVEGFVFGILDAKNEVDIERNTILINLAQPYPCTFHRAFDIVVNPEKSLNEISEIGFDFILTSGSNQNPMDDVLQLKKLIAFSRNKIEIIVGGGVRSLTISELNEKTKATFFHSSALIDNSGIANIDEIKKLKEQLSINA